MTTTPRGITRFRGEPKVFFMAVCDECDMAMPFDAPLERDVWTFNHITGTGHSVSPALDVRGDAEVLALPLYPQLGDRVAVAEGEDAYLVLEAVMRDGQIVWGKKSWTPFDGNGFLDDARLAEEGWHYIGAIREDGIQ